MAKPRFFLGKPKQKLVKTYKDPSKSEGFSRENPENLWETQAGTPTATEIHQASMPMGLRVAYPPSEAGRAIPGHPKGDAL